MDTLKYRFNLDCNKIGVQKTLQGIQTGDVMARQCVISLTAGTKPVEFPTDDSIVAMMYVKTPNATTPSINACTVDQTAGTVTYDILPADIATAGVVSMQVKVIAIKGDNVERVLVAPKFEMEIEESDVSDSSSTTTTQYTALESAIAQAQAVYNSRLISVTVDDEYTLIVTYADGSTYESTGIVDAYNALFAETLAEFDARLEAAESGMETSEAAAAAASASASAAADSASAAAESELNAAASVVEAGEIKDATDAIKTATQGIKDAAVSETTAIKEAAAAELLGIKQDSIAANTAIAEDSEAFALGTRNGVAVDENDKAYHKNAKFFADLAGATADAQYVSWGAAQDLSSDQKAVARNNIAVPSVTEMNTAIDNAKTVVDTAMSDTSENPVQNKVVKAAIDAVQSAIPTIDDALSDTSENPVQNKVIKAAIDAIPIITVDSTLDDTSENPVQNKVVYELADKVIADVSVPTTAWVADTTYSDYGYKADITFSGVDSNYFADVVLAPTEATSGVFAPVCLVSTNTVTIYASDAPSEDITIPLIKVVKVVTV